MGNGIPRNPQYSGDTRPQENISYNDIRGSGSHAGNGWPIYGHAVDSSSFMGILRTKTGLLFDLPTESEWEYACRAGTTTALNSGKNVTYAEDRADPAMNEVGRYCYNVNDGKGGYEPHTKVGCYLANNWGLYDMHGNAWEWCLDWASNYDTNPQTDPVGAQTGYVRVLRGGSCRYVAGICRSAMRFWCYPDDWDTTKQYPESDIVGFRIVCHPQVTMFSVGINGGTAVQTMATEGTVIEITADEPANGMVFDRWVSNDVVFADATAMTTTFTMPAKNVSITAIYTNEQTYTITVNYGTANKTSARAGETVTITANTPAANKLFSKWTTTSGVTFASATSATTTFTMPAKNVTVTATYVDKTFIVTVGSGTANKTTAKMGETVTVTANDPANGMIFDRWVSNDVAFANATAMTTTFTMPSKDVTVTATYVPDPNVVVDDTLYVVIDLSGGHSATSYPVRYSAVGPDLNDDTCRTTELWLRKVPAGTFQMGSPTNEAGRQNNETLHNVTLTKDAYIGVFECTQEQWKLVMGRREGFFSNETCYATRPVENVSYVDIRGSSNGAGWPANGHLVDNSSFIGRLRARTGLEFDLPTEALWEYACRAGTTTALNTGRELTNPSGADEAVAEAGRYYYNGGSGFTSACTDQYGTAKVGSYLPNAWGLYDMHGNVSEWCLDWLGTYDTVATDPVGATSGSYRVMRGGNWQVDASQNCRSARRQGNAQTKRLNIIGFRLALQP